MSHHDLILTLNAGSSSIKFKLFEARGAALEPVLAGGFDGVGLADGRLRMRGQEGEALVDEVVAGRSHADCIAMLAGRLPAGGLRACAHRVVHGGEEFVRPVRVDAALLGRLEAFTRLAPLHQPHNLAGLRAMRAAYPGTPQIACFDTAFHATQPAWRRMLPLPRHFADEGVKAYGFHGLSYEYVASVLPQHLGARAWGRVVVAHLGNGASACAMLDCRSQASTMGFTAVDGLMMGTRTGSLDPGVVLYLMQQGMGAAQIAALLYQESGLLGVSGLSPDMRVLLEAAAGGNEHAAQAIDLFADKAASHIAGLAVKIGGLDALVFTGGIGENAAPVREKIARLLGWAGVRIDARANEAASPGARSIAPPDSPVALWVIPTDEERVMAKAALALS
ncbi:MAG: acetate/propionate family kinase [Betaproteobacteria bacterium]|nr:acetate/propionate family kinase [Betaproteobacteria bacterium]